MDLRMFTMALVLTFSSLTSFAHGPQFDFQRKDFSHAEGVQKNGKSLVHLDLSESGKKKILQINKTEVGKAITLNVAGKSQSFTLREPITGNSLEAGPFDAQDAKKMIDEINSK
jgi:preprotein translocase subunit SecD